MRGQNVCSLLFLRGRVGSKWTAIMNRRWLTSATTPKLAIWTWTPWKSPWFVFRRTQAGWRKYSIWNHREPLSVNVNRTNLARPIVWLSVRQYPVKDTWVGGCAFIHPYTLNLYRVPIPFTSGSETFFEWWPFFYLLGHWLWLPIRTISYRVSGFPQGFCSSPESYGLQFGNQVIEIFITDFFFH